MKIIVKTLNGIHKEIDYQLMPTVGELRYSIANILNCNWDDITVRNIIDKNNNRLGSIYLDDPGELFFDQFLSGLNNSSSVLLNDLTFFVTNNMGIDRFRPVENNLSLIKQFPLPTLVFSENHYDPITKDILAKMIPTLKALGYSCYCPERGASYALENAIDKIRLMEKHLHNLYSHIKHEYNQDLDFSSVNALLHPFSFKVIDKDKIAALMSLYSHKSLYYGLRRNQIAFQGIDIEKAEIDALCARKDTIPKQVMEIRDKKMANGLLNCSGNNFGHVGLFHVDGIQRNILCSLTLEEAKKRFRFIHLYTCHKEKDREYLQSTDFPLGIHCIQSSLNDAEKVISKILKEDILKENSTPRVESISLGLSRLVMNL